MTNRRVSTTDSHRRITRQTLWMGAVTAVELLGAFVHVFVAARVLGVEGFGALAIIVATATLIHGLAAIPGGDTVTTFATRSVTEGRPSEAASILRFAVAASLGLSLVAYGAIAVLTLTVGGLLRIDEANASAMLLYGLVGVLLATRSEALAVLRLSNRLGGNLVVTLADNLTRVTVLAVVWFVGGGLVGVVLAHVAGAAVSFVGMTTLAAMFAGRAGIKGLLRQLSLRVPADVIGFHIGAYGRTTIGALTQNLDTVLVAQLAGAVDVGLYRAARQIMDMTRRPFQLIRFGVQPELSRQWYSGQGAALRGTVLRFTVYSLALATVSYAMLAAFRSHIASLILGPEFDGVSNILLILIPGAFVASLAILGALPVATGRVWPSITSTAAEFIVALIAMVWLVPLMGSEGAAWARTTSTIVAVLVLLPFVASILRRSYTL